MDKRESERGIALVVVLRVGLLVAAIVDTLILDTRGWGKYIGFDGRHDAMPWLRFVARKDACLLALVTLLWVSSGGLVTADTLRTEIESLASEQGFHVNGVDLIGEEAVSDNRPQNPADQISQLLANYNFIVTRDSGGRISQLTIVGMRVSVPDAPESTSKIKGRRSGPEHYVDAVVQGPNGHDLPLSVMVDTGASTLVLPRSLAVSLGYTTDGLRAVQVQTANGMTKGLSATLQSVRVGDAETSGVAVTFVEDKLLGGKRLLGMSFLGRFRMTIDGSDGLLQLEERSN